MCARDVAFGVDQVELAVARARHRRPGASAPRRWAPVPWDSNGEPARPVERVEQRLRRQRSDAAVRVWAERPTAKKRLATTTPKAPLGSRATIDQVMCGSRQR